MAYNVLSCPSGSDTVTHTWTDASTTVYLRRTYEPIDDTLGNNNGLCESGETCIYTPNIGAYQGHGSIVSAATVSGCADIGTDGTVTNVTLLQYQTNGY